MNLTEYVLRRNTPEEGLLSAMVGKLTISYQCTSRYVYYIFARQSLSCPLPSVGASFIMKSGRYVRGDDRFGCVLLYTLKTA